MCLLIIIPIYGTHKKFSSKFFYHVCVRNTITLRHGHGEMSINFQKFLSELSAVSHVKENFTMLLSAVRPCLTVPNIA